METPSPEARPPFHGNSTTRDHLVGSGGWMAAFPIKGSVPEACAGLLAGGDGCMPGTTSAARHVAAFGAGRPCPYPARLWRPQVSVSFLVSSFHSPGSPGSNPRRLDTDIETAMQRYVPAVASVDHKACPNETPGECLKGRKQDSRRRFGADSLPIRRSLPIFKSELFPRAASPQNLKATSTPAPKKPRDSSRRR
jgi:hypothetical protein